MSGEVKIGNSTVGWTTSSPSYCGLAGCCHDGGAAGITTTASKFAPLGAGGAVWAPVQVNNETFYFKSGGMTMSCCEKKGNTFYQYELSLFDLSYSETKNPDRQLIMIQGAIELSAERSLTTDILLLKHAVTLAPYAAKAADVEVRLHVKETLKVQPKP